jgi:predicted SAM-dependent methyltransferase
MIIAFLTRLIKSLVLRVRSLFYYEIQYRIQVVNPFKKEEIRRAKKIIVGGGGKFYPGWSSTDKHLLDLTKRDSFLQYWQPNSRVAFLAEHVWEHLDASSREKANANCFEFLKSGGWLRIAVPDGFHPDPSYIQYVRPGGTGAGTHDHKVLFNYQSLTKELQKIGFEVELLEYWDENGKFHFCAWSSDDGYVERSKRYDPRNKDGSLKYTSLIVDAKKL